MWLHFFPGGVAGYFPSSCLYGRLHFLYYHLVFIETLQNVTCQLRTESDRLGLKFVREVVSLNERNNIDPTGAVTLRPTQKLSAPSELGLEAQNATSQVAHKIKNRLASLGSRRDMSTAGEITSS